MSEKKPYIAIVGSLVDAEMTVIGEYANYSKLGVWKELDALSFLGDKGNGIDVKGAILVGKFQRALLGVLVQLQTDVEDIPFLHIQPNSEVLNADELEKISRFILSIRTKQ